MDQDFVNEATLAQMRQAVKDHPATEHTNAGGNIARDKARAIIAIVRAGILNGKK